MRKFVGLSIASSAAAFGVAACCVLPMIFLLAGLGGSWLAVFGKLAATGYYVLAASSALVAISVFLAVRNGSLPRLKWWLAGSAGLSLAAWILVINEARLNDYLMTMM